MSGRRTCPDCGATYNITYNPTKVEGICDNCGKPIILREDDKPETVNKRLEVYHNQTKPLIDYYAAKDKIVEIDGAGDIDKIFEAIVRILGE